MRVKKSVTIEEGFNSYIENEVKNSKTSISYSDVLNNLLLKSVPNGVKK